MWYNQVNFISLQSSWLRNVSFEQGYAHREREPCIGTYEHRHNPNLRKDNHAET